MLRLDSDVAPIARKTRRGFIAYFAVASDSTTLYTTRVFQDSASLQAETTAANAVSLAINTDFGLTNLEVIVEGPVGVARGYGPIEEFTP